jgi:threonine dehydrogenase-like Zn-dependent dehydrogenase
VLAVGKHPEKLAILEKRGIATVLASEWNGELASLVVEATGTAKGFARAVAATRPRGTLVLKSTVFERPSVDLSPIVVDEIRVVGSRCGPFPPALRALETGSVDVGSLISHRVALDDAVEGMRKASQPGALKILIEP